MHVENGSTGNATQRPRLVGLVAPILLVLFVAVQVVVMLASSSTPECLEGFSLEEVGGHAPAPVYECVAGTSAP